MPELNGIEHEKMPTLGSPLFTLRLPLPLQNAHRRGFPPKVQTAGAARFSFVVFLLFFQFSFSYRLSNVQNTNAGDDAQKANLHQVPK